MHNNPAKRGLVKEPGAWPWSSWRYYFLQHASLLAINPQVKACGYLRLAPFGAARIRTLRTDLVNVAPGP